MKKPELRDYVIDESDIRIVERTIERLESSCAFIAYGVGILCGICFAIYSYRGQLSTGHEPSLGQAIVFGVLVAIVCFPTAAIPLAIVLGIVESCYVRFSDRVRRVNAYKSAVNTFEKWRKRTQREFWVSLSGKQFEVELARLYRAQGYSVSLTPSSGDGGVDLALGKDGRTTIVQCKAHRKAVGPHAIRDLYGTLMNVKAHEAILASLAGFTPGVRAFAKGKPIQLVDLADIIKLQDRLSE